MTDHSDLLATLGLPVTPQVLDTYEIDLGTDRILYAKLAFAQGDAGWIDDLPELRGQYAIPAQASDALALPDPGTVENPPDLSGLLGAPWSKGFLIDMNGDWLLIAETQ